MHDADSGEPKSGTPKFELYGPGDVRALRRSAIKRRYPTPGARDAEETKLAMIELDAPDLPWRYSPSMPGADTPRRVYPWFVVVVGALDEITVLSGRRVMIGKAAQAQHDLAWSWQWAHVHQAQGRHVARVLSPRNLAPTTDYVACVVPAYTKDGKPSWDATDTVTLPLYDWWRFRTGEEGDFPKLAAKLRVADLDALALRAGKRLGQAGIRYKRRQAGTPDAVDLATFGALTVPGTQPPPAPPAWVVAEVADLTKRIVSPDGRAVVTSPRYPAPFTTATPPGGWAEQLTTDPRNRGAAGLGAWAAIEWQDKISEAAAVRAGDLEIARDRVAQLALGLMAARSMWRRHVPADPVDRLALLAPMLGRMPTTTDNTVLQAVSGRTREFTRALFSSAARRALRPGPARTARAKPRAAHPAHILLEAAECPGDPTSLPDVDAVRLREAVAALPRRERREMDAADSLEAGLGIDRMRAVQETLARHKRPCRRVDIAELGGRIAAAVNPSVERPLVVDLVLDTLDGVTGLGPVEIEPELDLPLWSFLSEHAPDWMLPGAGDLAMHDIVALGTNPSFVHAVLAGANHQALAELRWRNLPIRPGWSPLRKFWQREADVRDIVPIKSWSGAESLGAATHAEVTPNDEAVILFRSTLFRRYPATVVFLFQDNGGWQAPDETQPLTGPRRVEPTFRGAIGDDIVFFGFPIAAQLIADYWVVLEEPPSGFSFHHPSEVSPTPFKPGATSNHSAAKFAQATLAEPARVLVAPLVRKAP